MDDFLLTGKKAIEPDLAGAPSTVIVPVTTPMFDFSQPATRMSDQQRWPRSRRIHSGFDSRFWVTTTSHSSSPISSPFIVPMACQASSAMLSLTKRTEASHRTALTPPG